MGLKSRDHPHSLLDSTYQFDVEFRDSNESDWYLRTRKRSPCRGPRPTSLARLRKPLPLRDALVIDARTFQHGLEHSNQEPGLGLAPCCLQCQASNLHSNNLQR